MKKSKISIIIPVFNEAPTIAQTLKTLISHADSHNPPEIIVVDGGSEDETVSLARREGATVLSSPPGKAAQMNVGAAHALGEVLLFLHADTRLPEQYQSLIEGVLHPPVIAGAFDLGIDGESPLLRWVEKLVKVRSRWCSLPYGDQAIFLKATTFQELGGFPPLPIMEDFELVRQLRKRGTIQIIPFPVITSARRWEKLGILKTTWINQGVVMGYFLGVSPHRLARWYRGNRE
ncbi:TIGR04283 family arsenosugar biosynthesis glycosyltransferase [Spirulina subsalsa]|uniref:TIGR04283 family arsenosugar biosynthesis glycosyltransferase n=1 Tax=Spirulina subsalsa TaxID=54311 RepID=UPI0022388756|nr:TIGR04283 family arsenosugar biosynthesis glycosyltransferase [Spirulina subsalsa]